MTKRFSAFLTLAALTAGCSSPQAVAPPMVAPNALPARHHVTISQFADLPVYYDYYGPSAVAAGPHHALWVTDTVDQDFGENAVIEIATSGKGLNTFYYGGRTTEGSDLTDLAAGSDGALWIADYYNSQVLRMTTAGSFTAFPLSTEPFTIVAGPDKALWFTESDAIGRITTAGNISIYPASGSPAVICVGPDGALWFTESTNDSIGRITTRGKIKYYSKGITAGSYPFWIAAGPDGALWFTEYDGGRIGRITAAGKVTEYSKGITAGEFPDSIAQGPDDAMWFTESATHSSYQSYNGKIGRITTSGRVTEYDNFNTQSAPSVITQGADKNMWFTESAANEMGRVNL